MLSLCFLLPHLTTCCLTIMCGLGKTRSRQDAWSQHAFSSALQAETAGCLLFFSAHERVMPTAFSSRSLSVFPRICWIKAERSLLITNNSRRELVTMFDPHTHIGTGPIRAETASVKETLLLSLRKI